MKRRKFILGSLLATLFPPLILQKSKNICNNHLIKNRYENDSSVVITYSEPMLPCPSDFIIDGISNRVTSVSFNGTDKVVLELSNPIHDQITINYNQ